MAKVKKTTVEYRWEAYYPETGEVFRRGTVRTDYGKVVKNANELIEEIATIGFVTGMRDRFLASYWEGAEVRIVGRTISPWTEVIGW